MAKKTPTKPAPKEFRPAGVVSLGHTDQPVTIKRKVGAANYEQHLANPKKDDEWIVCFRLEGVPADKLPAVIARMRDVFDLAAGPDAPAEPLAAQAEG